MGRFRVDVRDFPHNHYLLLKALYRVPAMRLAPVLAWMSADTVSWLAFASGLGAGTAIALGRYLPAILLLHLSMLLDYVDGEVARHRGETSLRGAWMEVVLDKTQAILIFAVLGFAASQDSAAAGEGVWIWDCAAISAFLLLAILRLQRVRLVDLRLASLRASAAIRAGVSPADAAGARGLPPRRRGWRLWVLVLWRETSPGYVTWLWIITLALLTAGPLHALYWTALYGWVRIPLEALVTLRRTAAIDAHDGRRSQIRADRSAPAAATGSLPLESRA
jgi:phosphatidylglycerophosphate synthase